MKLSAGLSALGTNAYELVPGKTITEHDFKAVANMLRLNYGAEYSQEKFVMLVSMMAEDGWSGEKLRAASKWFMRTKKFPAWTVADWYEYDRVTMVYPHSWYQRQIAEGRKDEEMIAYEVNHVLCWKLRDGEPMPLQEARTGATMIANEKQEDEPTMSAEDIRKIIADVYHA